MPLARDDGGRPDHLGPSVDDGVRAHLDRDWHRARQPTAFSAIAAWLMVRCSTCSAGRRRRATPGHASFRSPSKRRRPFWARRPLSSRAEFTGSGFTAAHLTNVSLRGWRMPSSIPVDVGRLAREGTPFIYVYYDGIDKIAHDKGLGEHFDAELEATDALVARVYESLPKDAVLVVTADHGQVEVPDKAIAIDPVILADVTMMSGEGRFRWLHTPRCLRSRCATRVPEALWRRRLRHTRRARRARSLRSTAQATPRLRTSAGTWRSSRELRLPFPIRQTQASSVSGRPPRLADARRDARPFSLRSAPKAPSDKRQL